jgi:hypothetical protein
MLMTMLEDEDAQRKGVVMINYNVGIGYYEDNINSDPRYKTKRANLLGGVPCRPTAVHYCYDDARIRPALAAFQLFLGTYGRLRFRAHYGTKF